MKESKRTKRIREDEIVPPAGRKRKGNKAKATSTRAKRPTKRKASAAAKPKNGGKKTTKNNKKKPKQISKNLILKLTAADGVTGPQRRKMGDMVFSPDKGGDIRHPHRLYKGQHYFQGVSITQVGDQQYLLHCVAKMSAGEKKPCEFVRETGGFGGPPHTC